MNSGRKPVNNANVLARDHITNGTSSTLLNDIIPVSLHNKMSLHNEGNATQQILKNQGTGNKCGHNSLILKFYSRPKSYKRRWHVLEEGLRNIKKSFIDPFDFPEFHGLTFESQRKIRSERREAELALLLPALIDSVNLVTMEAGYYVNKKFINYTYDHFMKLTGMNYCRVERNMRKLKERGLIDVKNIVKTLNDGAIRTEIVKIIVSEEIFRMLGIQDEFLRDREKAILNRTKEEMRELQTQRRLELFRPKWLKKLSQQTISNNDPIKDSCINHVKNLTKKLTNVHNNTNRKYNPAQDKRVLDIVGELLKRDPSISIADAIKIVSERNKAPPD
jgi:hypothetical protein